LTANDLHLHRNILPCSSNEVEQLRTLFVGALNDSWSSSGARQYDASVDDQVVRPGLGEIRSAGAVDCDVGCVGVVKEGKAECGARLC